MSSSSSWGFSALTYSHWRVRGVSSLRVPWRRDRRLDRAITRDKHPRLCARVIHEVLSSPRGALPLYYLENRRRSRLRLPFCLDTFLSRNPTLFDLYPDRLTPSSNPTTFLRPSTRLVQFLSDRRRLLSLHEPLALSKLRRLLMMSRHRALPLHKLLDVRRDFGLPDDLATSLVPGNPDLLRLTPSGYLELLSWDDDLARSAIERRADEEADLTGIRMRPNFEVRLPRGLLLRKEMREWTRDWLELPYVSPYADASALRSGTIEMEKRMVGVLHEVLSLAVRRRMAVPSVGKFREELRLSNEFAGAFARHPGLFYVSPKGGVGTAMLREAFGEDGELVDRDPLLEIDDKFVEMLEEGHQVSLERERARKEAREMERTRERIEDERGDRVADAALVGE